MAAGAQAPPLIYSAVLFRSVTPNLLTLLGTNFAPTGGLPSVTFDGNLLTRQSYGNTSIKLNMPTSTSRSTTSCSPPPGPPRPRCWTAPATPSPPCSPCRPPCSSCWHLGASAPATWPATPSASYQPPAPPGSCPCPTPPPWSPPAPASCKPCPPAAP